MFVQPDSDGRAGSNNVNITTAVWCLFYVTLQSVLQLEDCPQNREESQYELPRGLGGVVQLRSTLLAYASDVPCDQLDELTRPRQTKEKKSKPKPKPTMRTTKQSRTN